VWYCCGVYLCVRFLNEGDREVERGVETNDFLSHFFVEKEEEKICWVVWLFLSLPSAFEKGDCSLKY
jgi:hypothetical protein